MIDLIDCYYNLKMSYRVSICVLVLMSFFSISNLRLLTEVDIQKPEIVPAEVENKVDENQPIPPILEEKKYEKSLMSSTTPLNLLAPEEELEQNQKDEKRRWFYIRYGIVAGCLSLVFCSYLYGRDKTPLI